MAAQIIIVIISLVMKDYQIIKNGNLVLLGISALLAGTGASGAAGWGNMSG